MPPVPIGPDTPDRLARRRPAGATIPHRWMVVWRVAVAAKLDRTGRAAGMAQLRVVFAVRLRYRVAR